MKEIIFYKLSSGKSPIEEFLDGLSAKEAQKVVWVLQLMEEESIVSTKFYKQLSNSDGIVEVRVQHGNNNFRLMGFEHNGTFVVLTNAFRKKDQKVPKKEIELAQKRKKEYLTNE
ncbi:type II toxin-antitoxin system RelE/ParE family toxin [Sulfurimonas sp. HSL3-2]|uniref:type II toxin-antitoxin system RelE/ParE family toxin n=1 Tax=Hydrocurvibacter mobilis TaxID=3131936 RepID=UPI0031F8874A